MMEHVRKNQRIAMFGGTFNPPHRGHVEVASRIRDEYKLDKVLFMVAGEPPHKQISDGVDAQTRLALTKAAIDGIPGLEACDMELRRCGKSYTADTLRELGKLYDGAELILIIGEDMLENLPTWHQPEAILAMAKVITASRPGCAQSIRRTAKAIEERYGAEISIAEVEGPDISSTDVRSRVREALPISALVPKGVERAIYELLLYQPPEIQRSGERLRRELKPSRYLHSIGAMRCSIELAARFGCDGKKARLAGLLHDCAKLPDERLVSLAKAYGIAMDEYDSAAPGLLHDRVGAVYAKEEYGVTDRDILRAIESHTRCEKGMDGFARMIYVADKIEPTRDYNGVERIREAAATDINRAALLCMKNVLAHLESKGLSVQPNIYDAIEELNEIIIKEDGI